MGEPRATISAYTVSRLPDTDINYDIWSVRVEAAGLGRWAVRRIGRCLNKQGEWEYEPIPSERDEAIAAAIAAEPTIVVNGMTSADVLARFPSPSEEQT